MVKTFIFVLIAEFCMAAGHVCFKKSASQFSRNITDGKLRKNFIRFLSQPTKLWIGIIVMVIGLFFWFEALGSGELSVVYLLGSVQYILLLIASHFFLNEKINHPKLIGTLLIGLGIIFITIS